jgi:hypothetical protein
MEVNTVCISIEEYNELKMIKDGLEKGEVIAIGYGLHAGITHYCLGKDIANNTIAEENQRLHSKIINLNKQIYNLVNTKRKKLEVSDIMKMSIWQFIKYRKLQNKAK